MIKSTLNKLSYTEQSELVNLIGTESIQKQFKAAEQINLAIKLIKMKLPQSLIARRLIIAFQIGRSTAYRRITSASQYLDENWTCETDNIFIVT
jgi:DNA invertase Pin-like site-specific DNA recombinase